MTVFGLMVDIKNDTPKFPKSEIEHRIQPLYITDDPL